MDWKFISDNWFPIAGALMTMVWLVRLEAKILYLEKDHDLVARKIDAVQDVLNSVQQALARIEGRLEKGRR